MVKIRFTFTEEDAKKAQDLAAKIYALFPLYFEMRTPEPKDGVFHIYLNPRGKFRK